MVNYFKLKKWHILQLWMWICTIFCSAVLVTYTRRETDIRLIRVANINYNKPPRTKKKHSCSKNCESRVITVTIYSRITCIYVIETHCSTYIHRSRGRKGWSRTHVQTIEPYNFTFNIFVNWFFFFFTICV